MVARAGTIDSPSLLAQADQVALVRMPRGIDLAVDLETGQRVARKCDPACPTMRW
jgi:hypothetical protein